MPDAIPRTTTSYLVAIGDLSVESRTQMRADVDATLVDIALQKKVTNDPSSLVVRNVLPFTDLGLTGGTNGEEWLIPGAGTAGTEFDYVSKKQLTTTQAMGFWGAGSPMASPNLGYLKFYYGSSKAQVKAIFQLEELVLRLENEGYFSAPIYYAPQEYVTLSVMPFTSFPANTERLKVAARVVEPFGTTVSAPNT